jgi:multicomponent Na+:H+ antiporter subunit D
MISMIQTFIQSNIAILPIVICFLMAPIMLFLRQKPRQQKIIAMIAGALLLLLTIYLFYTVYTAGIQVYDIGEFGKYGIVLVADLLSALMVLLTAFISFGVLIYSFDYIEKKSLSNSYYPLFFMLMAGINGIFLTGDLFNLFVFFEIMFLSSTGLIMANEALNITDTTHKLEASYKYLVLGIIGSMMMLVAITTIYATVGSLNIADIAAKIQILSETGTMPWVVIGAALLFVVVFGNKAALVPLHFWLPDVHPTAPTPISAMLSGILIKIGAYGILRVLFVILAPTKPFFLPILMFFALLTIAIGAISAMGQTDLKRVLAYSSVSQIGYVLLGLSFGTIGAIAAAVMYMVNHAVAKSMLFLTAGGIIHTTHTRDLRKMGGLISILPLFSAAFLIGALSIAGFPPMGGFVAKFALFQETVLEQFYLPLLIAVVCAVITIFYMFKTWIAVFWGENMGSLEMSHPHKVTPEIIIPIVMLCVLVVLLGVYPEPLYNVSNQIAAQILDPTVYISAVLEGAPR